MNDEIKEVLHLLKRCDNSYLKIENSNGEKEYEYHQVNDLRLDGYHSQLLLDYITNLQEENEKLILELSGYREAILRDDKLLGLKSRIDKAIDYIKTRVDSSKASKYELLDILNGSDENE